MATLHVDVVSAEELIFSGEAKFVALPGENEFRKPLPSASQSSGSGAVIARPPSE